MSDSADPPWARIREVFEQAAAHRLDEREAYLDAECAGEPRLREQVELLLSAHDSDDGSFEPPVLDAAASTTDVPPELEAIVLGALALDPEQRFAATANDDSSAPAMSSSTSGARGVRRWLGIAAAVMIVAVVAAWMQARSAERARAAELAAERAREQAQQLHDEARVALDRLEQRLTQAESERDDARAELARVSSQAERMRGVAGTGAALTSFLAERVDAAVAAADRGAAQELLDAAARELPSIADDGARMRIGRWLGESYLRLGRAAVAEPLLRQSLTLSRSLHGDEHLATLSGHLSLARAIGEQGRHTEASQLRDYVHATVENVFGAEHALTRAFVEDGSLPWTIGDVADVAGALPESGEDGARR